jgi:hypothetical protein
LLSPGPQSRPFCIESSIANGLDSHGAAGLWVGCLHSFNKHPHGRISHFNSQYYCANMSVDKLNKEQAMREIKFRGYSDATGWVYGGIAFGSGYATLITRLDSEGGDVEVAPDTVGQYIGLLDKNRREIYEGDILELSGFIGQSDPPEKFIVEYDDGIASFIYEDKPRGKSRCRFGISIMECNLIVIGTIHDNPELVEAKS